MYLLDFFCSGIQFYLKLSLFLCLVSLLYLDLYVLGDDALISKGSFMQVKGVFYVFSVLRLLCLCVRLFICALWSPAGKGLTSWFSFVVSNCEFVTFPLVSWIRCGT